MERGQRFTRPHPPSSQRPLPGGGSAAGRRPRAGCRLPRGAGPTPNPSGSPAPTHPGAGVGGCRVGSWSNRRGSSAPHTSWLQKARSRPSYLRRSKPGPRAPRARGSCYREPGAGGREGAERPAARGRAQQPPPRGRSLARSLPRSVGSCVRLSVGPSLPRRRRRRSSPGSAACPLPASPLRSRARGLAACSLAPCPRHSQRRAEQSPAAADCLARSLSRRGRQRGRGAGGAERRVRGRQRGCALGFRPISAGERLRPGGERGAARQRRERGGGPGGSPRKGAQGEGVRGGVTPARGCGCGCV